MYTTYIRISNDIHIHELISDSVNIRNSSSLVIFPLPFQFSIVWLFTRGENAPSSFLRLLAIWLLLCVVLLLSQFISITCIDTRKYTKAIRFIAISWNKEGTLHENMHENNLLFELINYQCFDLRGLRESKSLGLVACHSIMIITMS